MGNPKISVIVPVYNVDQYLARCLDSIVCQSLDALEIIVVNDGSTDDSQSIIDRYHTMDARIIALQQPNAGLSAARNSGLDLATGEFVAFVDSDDFIDPQMFEETYRKAIATSADIVQCGFNRVDENGVVFFKSIEQQNTSFKQMLEAQTNRAVWNKLFRRSLISENNLRFPVGLYHEDLYFSCAAYFFANRVANIGKCFYNWFTRRNSISASITKKHIGDVFSGFQLIADLLESQGALKKFGISFRLGCFRYALATSERINEPGVVPESEKLPVLDYLSLCLHEFSQTNKEAQEQLQADDLNLYLRFKKEFSMSDLLGKTRDELIAELKSARLKLYLQEKGVDDFASYVNYEFSHQFNRIHQWIKWYKKSFGRIALYGNGLLGQVVARELKGQLVVVADANAENNATDFGYEVCMPERLQDYDFDCILICVFGREDSIRSYIENTLNVSSDKIKVFNLLKEAPATKSFEVDYRNLITRVGNNRPIIGEHPLSVQIQTVSTCNANCYFCPYVGSWHQKNPGRMDDDLYYKIVDELSKYKIKKFCPYLENEPFLDKKLFDKLQYAIDKLKPEIVEISTNLSYLLDRHIEGLANVLAKVPHELRISFHGIDKDSYENVMELDYEKSLANVKTVVAMMQDLPLNVMIRGSGEPRQSANLARRWFGEVEYRQFWADELAEFKKKPRLDFFTYHDRAGQSQLTDKGVEFDAQRETLKDFYCTRFDRWVHFLYTGEPILCCMDYNKETAFGNSVKDMSVEELFSSDAFVNMIKQGTGMCESKPDHICKRCISPGG